jgi:hypothetical protein
VPGAYPMTCNRKEVICDYVLNIKAEYEAFNIKVKVYLFTRNLLCILIVASLRSLFEFMYSNLTVYAENVDRYWSVLTGDKQVPRNSTDSVVSLV